MKKLFVALTLLTSASLATADTTTLGELLPVGAAITVYKQCGGQVGPNAQSLQDKLNEMHGINERDVLDALIDVGRQLRAEGKEAWCGCHAKDI